MNWKNVLENTYYIALFGLLLILNNKCIMEPMLKTSLQEAGNKITQNVSQDIKNKFNVKKGGQVDASIQPIATPIQDNTLGPQLPVTTNDSTDCVDISGLSESRKSRIHRWLK